jgi:putative sigma-54 modulation protein
VRVEFTGRHIEVTEPIRQFALDRLERLRSLHDIIEVHFVLSAEKHQRHVAEINLKTRNDFHHCEEVTNDMYTSIASVLDKLERQVRKSKTRQMGQRRSVASPRVIEAESVAEVEPEVAEKLPEIVRSDSKNVKPLSVDDAAAELSDNGGAFLLFRNSKTERLNLVYRRKDGDIGWIDPEH